MHERIGDRHDAERRATGVMMVDAAAAGVRVYAPLVADPDMQSGIGEHPDAPQRESGDAGDGAAVRGGCEDGG